MKTKHFTAQFNPKAYRMELRSHPVRDESSSQPFTKGSIARNAQFRRAAFALLQDHSASSEEQNAAIQTKKKKEKNEQPGRVRSFNYKVSPIIFFFTS